MSTKMEEGVRGSMATVPSSDKLERVNVVFSVPLDFLLGGRVLDQNKIKYSDLKLLYVNK